MSIGNSGRVVIEMDPNLKRELYASLTRDGITLKDWFLQEAALYLQKKSSQVSLEVKAILNEAL